MPGRRNRPPTDDEKLAEHRTHERIERGEKMAGEDAEWLDRRGTAAHAGTRRDADKRHSHVRQR